jgi:hypothetical protein
LTETAAPEVPNNIQTPFKRRAQSLRRLANSAESGTLCYGINWHDERLRHP